MDLASNTRPPERVEIRRSGERALVSVAGEIDLYNAARLQTEFEAAGGGANHVVLDLSGVEFIDSSGLRAVISAQRSLQRSGIGFSLLAPSRRVQRILEVTGLDRVLPIEALAQS